MDAGRTKIRLLLLDSHNVMRIALRYLLEARGYEVVGASGDVRQGVALVTRLKPAIVLMESHFPQGDAMQACRDMRVAAPDTRVIFLASAKDGGLRVAGILAGADAYLHKEAGVEELVRTIGMVMRGTPAIDVETIQSLRMQSGARAAERAAPAPGSADMAELTPQERRILPLIARGMTNKQIGEALGLSHKTVKNHLSSVFQKLQVNRRAQLAALVATARLT